ncbi:MAG: penicillin-binding protein 2 [Pseudomonadota bacterium]|nr:penicillin-binding protein 2 [Pseudomonadota bacterium]
MNVRKRPRPGNAPRGRAARDWRDWNLKQRVLLVGSVMGLCAVALVGRAAYVQLVDSEFYQDQGDQRFQRDIEIAATRGMITDRNGEPLAVSTPVQSIWANPAELAESPDNIRKLALALEMSPDELGRNVAQRADKQFLWIKRRMNPALADQVMALGIPGVHAQREFRRFYPQGEAFAHVLGFTNIDDYGQEGVELALDDWLRGKPGQKRIIRDNSGRQVENVDLLRAAEPGKDVALSIDRRIQYLTYRELKKMIEDSGAVSGSAVVLDVRNGEVLAMANLPSFNPNNVGSASREAHRNRALTDLLEPGSTIKPLTVAAGLEAGVINANSTFNTSPGWIANGRYRTTDTRNYGVLNTTGLIQKSSNVGMALIAHKLSNQQMYDFLRKFGYGQRTGIGFPGEAAGLLPVPARWDGTSKQTMSYGYAFNATPMQIVHAYATLANGGEMIQPTFVKDRQGERKQVLDPEIARSVLDMMQTVTETGGTATRAAILGYHVAGKTGTARKASGGGYSRRYVAYFAGIVPVENPRYAMVVAVDDPDPSKGFGYYGGLISAPVFQRVMDNTLRLMDVPPDDIETWIAAQQKTIASQRGGTLAAAPASAALPAALPPPLPQALEEAP